MQSYPTPGGQRRSPTKNGAAESFQRQRLVTRRFEVLVNLQLAMKSTTSGAIRTVSTRAVLPSLLRLSTPCLAGIETLWYATHT
jgi:hypothetical protein